MPVVSEPQSGPSGSRLILGLGNPGGKYSDTRHNVGFRVVAELARRWGLRLRAGECNCAVAEAAGVLLAQPQTYMNRSGYAARCLLERHDLDPRNVLVVYDEVHLPLGRLRLRPAGTPGGHRGMESILESLRSAEVPRLRLGVGPADAEVRGEELADYVLESFTREELEAAEGLVLRAADACECWLTEGPEAAMNRFNG